MGQHGSPGPAPVANMAWDYFHTTAGSSLNAAHPPLVAQAQAVFDRTPSLAAPFCGGFLAGFSW